MAKLSSVFEKYSSAKDDIEYYKRVVEEWKKKKVELEEDLKRGERIKLIQDALGDIDIKDEYLEPFLNLKLYFPKSPEDVSKMYKLIKDADFSKRDVSVIMETYDYIKEPEKYDRVKEAIDKHKDLYTSLDKIGDSHDTHAIVGSYRIEFLKDDCSKQFYDSLHRLVRGRYLNIPSYGIPVERLMEVLPSKEFMKWSKEEARRLSEKERSSIWYRSAEDIILERMESSKFEKEYQEAESDGLIYLGHTEYGYGNSIYASFTKGQYEEDLKSAKALRKSKGENYVGW